MESIYTKKTKKKNLLILFLVDKINAIYLLGEKNMLLPFVVSFNFWERSKSSNREKKVQKSVFGAKHSCRLYKPRENNKKKIPFFVTRPKKVGLNVDDSSHSSWSHLLLCLYSRVWCLSVIYIFFFSLERLDRKVTSWIRVKKKISPIKLLYPLI